MACCGCVELWREILVDKAKQNRDQTVIDRPNEDELRKLTEIGRLIATSLSTDEAFEEFARLAKSLVPHDRLALAALTPDFNHVDSVFVSGIEVDQPNASQRVIIPHGRIKHQMFVDFQQYHAVDDELNELTELVDDEKYRIAAGLRSVLSTPLIWNGEPQGVMTLRSLDPKAFGLRQRMLANEIGRQIAGSVAMARQANELRRLAEEQVAIAEIGRIVSSTLVIEDVLASFVEVVRGLVPFDRVVVTAFDEDLNEVTDVLVDGLSLEQETIGISYPLPESKIQQNVILNQQTLVANNSVYQELAARSVAEVQRYNIGSRSLLMTPLVCQGRTVGTLNLRSKDPQAYGEHQRELAEQIAAQIAGAIATSKQYALLKKESVERERLSKQNDTIAEIGRIVSSTFRLQDVYSQFAEKARKLIPFDRIVIATLNPDCTIATDVLVEGEGTKNTVGKQFPVPGNVRELALRNHDPLILNEPDYSKEILPKYPLERDQMSAGLRSVMIVPLVSRGVVVGTIHFRSRENSPYNQETASVAAQIGSQIAGAVAASEQFESLRRSEELLRTQVTVFETSADSINILRPDGSIESVNDAYLKETGYTREEALNQGPGFLRPPGQDAEYEEAWDTLSSGRSWFGVLKSVRKNGEIYPVEHSVTPVFDDDGEIVRFVGIRRDVSDRLQAEEDRAARMRLDVENRELAEIARQREEFFTSVSHELRTPLTAIMSFADILSRDRQGTLTGLQLEHLDVIKRNSRSLNELVEDMLDFSRLGTDRLKLDRSDVEVHALVESVVESMEPTIRAKSQQVEVVSAPVPVWINADSGRITQVISNLMANSSKYSESGSNIRVELELINDYAHIKVVDQGVGISETEQDEIFTPFFRSKREDVQIQPGTGLGLAISKTLIELHDGQIQVSSIENEGSTFAVILPVTSHK